MFLAKKLNDGAGPPPATVDAQFNYVTMLLHGDGTNGAQNNTFLDSSTNNYTITRYGNTTQGSFSPYGSNWSNNFNGTNAYLSFPNNTAFAFGTGSFTIEFWINAPLDGDKFFLGGRSAIGGMHITSGGGGTGTTTGVLRYVATSTIVSSNVITDNTWHHCAIVRNGSSNITLYVDGVSVGTGTDTNNYTATSGTWYIARNDLGDANFLNGYLSNLRIVKGIAVYTSNFTPSTTPLTAISGTGLLTCADNRFIDDSANNFTITANGTPSVQRFNPFGTSTAYSTSVIGGSGYFDGSGDYLTAPSNAAFGFGTGDFTVECWVNPSSQGGHGSGNNDCIIDFRPNTGGGAYGTLYIYSSGTGVYWYANTANQITGGAIKNNAWTHLVVSRVSGSTRLFINGVQSGSTYADSTNYATGIASIAQFSDGTGGGYFNGYMSDVRVVKGSGVTSVTVPTTPLTAITNTSLLLSYTNAGIFDNAMMNDLETVGNAQISTGVKKFGTGSIYFDGTGDYLSTPSAPSNQMGSAPFTIEAWIYPTTISGTHSIIGKYIGGNVNASEYWLWITSTGKLAFVIDGNGGENYVESGAGAIVVNTWTHVAAIRTAGAISIYINGTQANSAGIAANYLSVNTTPLNIGAYNSGLGTYFGYIDELRITKGVARYSGASFTPPTAAFPNTGPV